VNDGAPIEEALRYALEGGPLPPRGNPLVYADPIPSKSQKDRALEARREISTAKRIFQIARMIKGGSAGDTALDAAFYNATDTAQMGNNTEDTGTHTPIAVGSDIIGETSRETNRDGRSAATFFSEFDRANAKDYVEHPIHDQVTGPTLFYAQKGAAYDERQPSITPSTEGPPSTPSADDVIQPFADGWLDHERNNQLNESKSMFSSFASLPHGKVAEAFRPRVDVFILDRKNRVLAGRSPSGNVIFPGGGIEDKEQLFAAGKREVLEEVGRRLRRIRSLGKPSRVRWTAGARKNQPEDSEYVGSDTTYLVAQDDGRDPYLHGADDGFKMRAQFRTIDKVLADLTRTAAKEHDYSDYDRAAIAALDKLQKRLSTKKRRAKRKQDLSGVDEAYVRVQHGPADVDEAFKAASMSAGHGAFDDRGTSTESPMDGGRIEQDPHKEEEWKYDDRMRTIDQSFREFDAPQTAPHNFEFSVSAGGL